MTDDSWSSIRVQQQSVATSFAARIEAKIAKGELSPGSRLPSERELAEAVGISRVSVRDAIHELVLRGLVDRKPGKGTVVKERSPESTLILDLANSAQKNLADAVDLRRAIEPEIAARAAERAQGTYIAKLSELLDRQEELAGRLEQPGDNERSVELDREFHAALARATANPLFVNVIDQLNQMIEEMRVKSHESAEGRVDSLAGHKEIFQAIQAGNSAVARAAMQHHVSTIASIVQFGGADG